MFKGYRFGVSLLRVGDNPDAQDKDGGDEVTQSQLIKNIEEHGGRVFGIVSKKTSVVVCSTQAFAAGTQKVRKAFKYGVPCVHEGWIEDSIAAGALQERAPYESLLGEPSAKVLAAANKKKRKKGSDAKRKLEGDDTDNNKTSKKSKRKEEKVTFDESKAVCTCLCHDEGDQTHCTWCGGDRPFEWNGTLAPVPTDGSGDDQNDSAASP